MEPLTRKEIETSFGSTIFARGLRSFKDGAVLDAWIDETGDVNGLVQGSSEEPYEVWFSIRRKKNSVRIVSNCTCPFESQCKHAAALAMYAISNDLEERKDDDWDGEIEEPQSQEPEIFLPPAPEVSLEIVVPEELRTWIETLKGAAANPLDQSFAAKYRLFYRVDPISRGGVGVPVVTPISRTILKSGAYGASTEIKLTAINAVNKPKYWSRWDVELLDDLNHNAIKMEWSRALYGLGNRHGTRLLGEILASDRCLWGEIGILRQGEPRPGKFSWQPEVKSGLLVPRLQVEGNCAILALTEPWYVDLSTLESGPIICAQPKVIGQLIRRGSIPLELCDSIASDFVRLGVSEELVPQTSLKVAIKAPALTPCLTIDFETCSSVAYLWPYSEIEAPIAFAKLTFEYQGRSAPADGRDLRFLENDEVVILRRNPVAEKNARECLRRLGWLETNYSDYKIPKGRGTSLFLAPASRDNLFEVFDRVQSFVDTIAPKLTEAGWKIHVDQNFRLVREEDIEWKIELESSDGIDWFEFQLGIQVEGQNLDLKPILIQALKNSKDLSLLSQARKGESNEILVKGPEGKLLKLSRARLAAVLGPLMDLFGGITEWPEKLRLPKAILSEVSAFEKSLEKANVPWKTNDELAKLRQNLDHFDRLEPVTEPVGFKGELREYQRAGLAWLQFLREFRFGGVLADDMGLGKTVQVLAHIQQEKVSGRMDRPSLIVAPTSTLPNWRREADKFTPELKVVTLRGGDRSNRFEFLQDFDIALTTYPLVARDREKLQKLSYHLLILDEAQNVKNPVTAAAKAVREIDARHRVCLSGTPVENHLGELWSLFQFLMPGFLGSDADFKKTYRAPIERLGDSEAKSRLSKRIKPFMLRRTKLQVVAELPPKTEIVETVDFDEPQRDLYESIRVSMDEQVRKLIATQGFDRSRIQILDALLKLRQVCCDPRLLKLPSARKVDRSAKLDRLMEMLEVLIEDGRRVLLFSQFTSMLDLIEERLKAANISWVRISGDTEDRETPVKRFQAREVPLFLISLKAGGTGLNLTAADTVILYDPWWNPAVESQAIDRAHRIGQEKSVMVYKLVAANTIEQKMLEIQARKGDIAKSILSEDSDGMKILTAEDLQWVLS